MEQKKFDVNSFIGMILLGGIIFWWMSTQEPAIDTTIETNNTEIVASPDSNNNTSNAFANTPVIENDSIKQLKLENQLGAFAQSAINASKGVSVIENEVVRLTINNKGGQIIEALVKNFKTYDALPLYLIKDNNASFNINFGTTDNRILNTKD